jgi:polar amino acid transport system substrate-binding protein
MALENTGQLERIQQKWFGLSTPIVQTEDYGDAIKYVIVVGIILVIIVIFMMTWNYTLIANHLRWNDRIYSRNRFRWKNS